MSHEVQLQAPGQPLPVTSQLAWKLAGVATSRPPLDEAAIDMVENRIIDCAAVSLGSLHRATVCAARAQAAAHPAAGGATVIGLPAHRRVCCSWAAWANVTAVRELDFHDNFYGYGVSHPAETIMPLSAVAEQCRRSGKDLIRGILTAYEVQVALASAFDFGRHHIDYVAHLGPAIAAGLGTLLGLPTHVTYQAINQAAHLSCAPLQARKGAISGWKASAPAHVAKLAVEAVDRAIRGQSAPAPIYEGRSGIIAAMLGGEEGHEIKLPQPDAPRLAILHTYPKAYAAAYHAQALIDLAMRLRPRLPALDEVESIVILTKDYTHRHIGSGSGDPEKMDPQASRETLDHSAMYIFAVALQDGAWHHERSYAPERAQRPDTVRLWHKVRTQADSDWTRRFVEPPPLAKDHGARVLVRLSDGRTIVEELAVPDAHPRGARPFGRDDYLRKLMEISDGLVEPSELDRFVASAGAARNLRSDEIGHLHLAVRDDAARGWQATPPAIFEWASTGESGSGRLAEWEAP